MSTTEVRHNYPLAGWVAGVLSILSWALLIASILTLFYVITMHPIAVSEVMVGAAEAGLVFMIALILYFISTSLRLMIDTEQNTRRSYEAINELIEEIRLQNEPVQFELEETEIDTMPEGMI